jgi:ABC-type Mn2+/Zn2+ transport system ATPase subunit
LTNEEQLFSTMSATDAAVLASCTELLPDLDPDIFEYIVGILQDEDVDEDSADTIANFLVSAEYQQEDEALVTAKKLLVQRLGGGSAPPAPPPKKRPVPKKTTTAPVVARVAAMSIQEQTPPPATQETTPDDSSQSSTEVAEEEQRAAKAAAAAEKKAAAKQARATKKKTGRKKNAKLTLAEQAAAQALEIETELHAARVAAVKARTKLGAYRGALEAASFTLPNPGGGQPLLEDAACTLVWGRRYGLIGRNGTGKSTMLRAFAARRVGDVPPNVTVHYVSQEVNLTDAQRVKTPVECVVDADIERSLLLGELAQLEALVATESLDAQGSKRHGEVLSRLDEIGSDSASRRAVTLLGNLGFSAELQARPLAQLSGGWRVRTMLAAALFAKADILLLDEP